MIQKTSSIRGYRSYKAQSLQPFDGDRIAVVIVRRGRRAILRGWARYVRRSTGNELEIKMYDDGIDEPTIVLQERIWDGHITPDREFGCDFQLRLEVDSASNCR
jgi:hypothetical protein